MLLVDRTWQSTTTYKYGFNGKENFDDVYGNDVAVDFGARVYDGRLGRWLSVDPLASKYSAWSPYAFAMNNPIIIIDPAGEDNVIYLVILESGEAFLKENNLTAADIINQANANFEKLGLKTRVVLAADYANPANSSGFDPCNSSIDATDAVAVIGNQKQIIEYFKSGDTDVEWASDLEAYWSDNASYRPEQSEIEENKDVTDETKPAWETENKTVPGWESQNKGMWITLNTDDIKGFSIESGISDLVKTIAFLTIHGAGHLSGLEHVDEVVSITDPGNNNSVIMYSGTWVVDVINNDYDIYNTIDDIITNQPPPASTCPSGSCPGRNAEYRQAMKTRFGDNDSTAKKQ